MIIIMFPEIEKVIFAAPDYIQNRLVPPESLHVSCFLLAHRRVSIVSLVVPTQNV